jgi:transposase-like protein
LLADENLVRLDWFWSNAIGGIKLWVNEEDAEAAASLLDAEIPEEFAVEGVGEFKQPRCPRCHSLDVIFEELNKRPTYAGLFFGLPIPWKRRRWKCNACGNESQDADGKPAPS